MLGSSALELVSLMQPQAAQTAARITRLSRHRVNFGAHAAGPAGLGVRHSLRGVVLARGLPAGCAEQVAGRESNAVVLCPAETPVQVSPCGAGRATEAQAAPQHSCFG